MRGSVGVGWKSYGCCKAAVKTEEMKEGPRLPRTVRTWRLPRTTLTRFCRRREGSQRSGRGLRVGAGVAQLEEGQRQAGSCGSASGLS